MPDRLLDAAKDGTLHPAFEEVARTEPIEANAVMEQVASGTIVIMRRKGGLTLGIGQGLLTKINANIGTSAEVFDVGVEVEKAMVAEKYGAHTVTDLSMGGPIDEIREKISKVTQTPLTTVPIYQTLVENGSFKGFTVDDLVAMIKKHVGEGISSIVVHAGFTMDMLEDLKGTGRIMGMVSKGGSFTSAWMLKTGNDNPYLARFDEICDILATHDAVLSLGNTMRSGAVHDPMDVPQEKEIEKNAELAKRANDHGVQVIVEGMGGHVNPAVIPDYIKRYKTVTGNRPLFVAGPLPIEVGVGYDHISACVGGALASGAGADYLCYITPSEHLALPNIQQVRDGVVAFRIAAHIGDTLKYGPRIEDKLLSELRKARDWESQFKIAIDGEKAREIHPSLDSRTCSMCGKYCAIAIMEEYLK